MHIHRLALYIGGRVRFSRNLKRHEYQCGSTSAAANDYMRQRRRRQQSQLPGRSGSIATRVRDMDSPATASTWCALIGPFSVSFSESDPKRGGDYARCGTEGDGRARRKKVFPAGSGPARAVPLRTPRRHRSAGTRPLTVGLMGVNLPAASAPTSGSSRARAAAAVLCAVEKLAFRCYCIRPNVIFQDMRSDGMKAR